MQADAPCVPYIHQREYLYSSTGTSVGRFGGAFRAASQRQQPRAKQHPTIRGHVSLLP